MAYNEERKLRQRDGEEVGWEWLKTKILGKGNMALKSMLP